MKKEVKVPSVGESITSGTVVTWLKHTGDRVEQGENLFELETDKAVLEIPSPDAGTLETLVEEGTEVEIGQTVAALISDGEAVAPPPSGVTSEAAEKPPAAAEKAEAPEPAAKKEPPPSPPPKAEEKMEPAQPALAQQKPPAKAPPPPAAPEPKKQTEQPAPSQPRASAERRVERVPMTTIRKRTAERLVQARRTAAHLTTFNEIDMQKVSDIRARHKATFEKRHGTRLGFMSFFVRACCQALKEFPAVNTQVEGDDIIYQYFYDIGVAMSIESGLIVPVLRDADSRSFAEIEATIADMAKRAQEKKLQPDELAGGTFTITNGGVFGSLLSTPIPAYPQTAILGMHAIRKRPVVIDDEIAIRPMMYVALSYDHRVIDGREAISFLARIRDLIEEPEKLLLQL
jgi:2-oxoglutarate dehydrogenase E2 component (dihydrolipoamide succinyltransferase)